METYLDDLDYRIIQATQAGLPRVSQPYHVIAERIGSESGEVMQRLLNMQESGIIRRIGVVPNHYKLGIRANGMSVWDIPDEMIDETGRQVGALDFVSHCYQRPRVMPEWPYNLFAMVHGKNRAEVESKVAQIADLLEHCCRQRDIIYSSQILKKTGLRLQGRE